MSDVNFVIYSVFPSSALTWRRMHVLGFMKQ